MIHPHPDKAVYLRLLLVAVLLVGPGCQGRAGLIGTSTGGGGGGSTVTLTDQDLAGVDAFIHHRNAQWILGDYVEVVASREYFGQNLTMTRSSGLVERRDEQYAEETRVTLTFVGVPGTEAVTTSPRILIGTGLTVTARKSLVLRLVKTRDADRPVFLQVKAQGRASTGRKDTVSARAPQLGVGGEIRRDASGRYVWRPNS